MNRVLQVLDPQFQVGDDRVELLQVLLVEGYLFYHSLIVSFLRFAFLTLR